MENEKKLYLIDAFALIFRSYFAFARNPLINSKGQNVSAISGFVSTLNLLLKKTNSTHIAVCFDSPEMTTREAAYPEYKANRDEAPEDIKFSIPYIKKIVKAFNIPLIEKGGYEADDIIGTLAKKAKAAGYDVYMVTMDKDYGQLMEEGIFMYRPSYTGNGFDTLTVEDILQKWEIENPLQVIDILGLMGDSIDNIPGVPGVGEKTAKKLIREFGSVEGVLANIGSLKGKMQENFINYKEQAIMSKYLATIILDVPVEFNEAEFIIDEPDKETLSEIFRELEFRKLGRDILGEGYSVNAERSGVQTDLFGNVESAATKAIQSQRETVETGASIENTPHNYRVCSTEEEIARLIEALTREKEIAFDTETTGIDANIAELVGLSFSWKKGEGYYVPVPADRAQAMRLIEQFIPVFTDTSITWIGQNIKYDYLILKWYGVELQGQLHDSMLAHYLLEPELRHNMDFLAENYLGYSPVSIETLIGRKGKNQLSMRDVAIDKIAEYAVEDADITLQLHRQFQPLLKKEQLEKVYAEVEVPLIPVLAGMEFRRCQPGCAIPRRIFKSAGKRDTCHCRRNI